MKTAESVLKKARERDMPVLVLVAQDQCAERAVYEYRYRCIMANCSKEHNEEIDKIYQEFRKWRKENPDKIKLPD